MKTFLETVKAALDLGASDIFIMAGSPIIVKSSGNYSNLDSEKLSATDSEKLIGQIYEIGKRKKNLLETVGDDDFAVSIPGLTRLRVNAYRQRGSVAAVARLIPFGIPNAAEMGIPSWLMEMAELKSGIIILSGTAGSGRSTTAACLIDRINSTRTGHIVTLEDPIEYLHKNKSCFISQRELGIDSHDYRAALRECRRKCPGVVFIDRLRYQEDILTALELCDTGCLVIIAADAKSPDDAFSKMLSLFSAETQEKMKKILMQSVKYIVCQSLTADEKGKLSPGFELMKPSEI